MNTISILWLRPYIHSSSYFINNLSTKCILHFNLFQSITNIKELVWNYILKTSLQFNCFPFILCLHLKLRLFLYIFPSAASSLSLRLRDTGTRWRHVCPRALSSTLQVADSGVGVRWRSNTHHMRSRSPSQRHLHGHLSLRLSAGHTSGGKKGKRWHDLRFDHPSCNGRRSEIPLCVLFRP